MKYFLQVTKEAQENIDKVRNETIQNAKLEAWLKAKQMEDATAACAAAVATVPTLLPNTMDALMETKATKVSTKVSEKVAKKKTKAMFKQLAKQFGKNAPGGGKANPTPPLNGTILPGVTRDSVLHIARNLELKVAERMISLDEVISALESGKLKEAFATGTAAVISPVGKLAHRGKSYVIGGGKVGPLSKKLYDQILGIQYGKIKDPYGWMEKVA